MGEKTSKHLVKKFASYFLQMDLPELKTHVRDQIIIPKIKELLSDGVKEAVDMLLYGEPQNKGSSKKGTYVSYNNFSKKSLPSPSERDERRENLYHPEADIDFETYYEADELRDILLELIDINGNVTVSEFLEEAGVTDNNNYMNERYGWTDLTNSKIIRRSGKYYLSFPRCREIRRD